MFLHVIRKEYNTILNFKYTKQQRYLYEKLLNDFTCYDYSRRQTLRESVF